MGSERSSRIQCQCSEDPSARKLVIKDCTPVQLRKRLAIDIMSAEACPYSPPIDPGSLINISQLVNKTKFDHESQQLPSFACYYYYCLQGDSRAVIASVVIKMLGCFLGLFGSISAILVFTRPAFRVVSFSYHTAINAADILNSLMFLDDGLSYLYDYNRVAPSWYLVRFYFVNSLNTVLQYWTNLLTVWVAIERCVATLLPRYFHVVNTKTVASGAMAATFLINLAAHLPYSFGRAYQYDEKESRYVDLSSEFRKSESWDVYLRIRNGYTLAVTCSMIVATVGVIVGLTLMSRRKKRLLKFRLGAHVQPAAVPPSDTVSTVPPAPASNPNSESLRQCSMNVQLCILQLCESIPLIVHEIFAVAHDRMPANSLASLKQLPKSNGYEESIDLVRAYLIKRGIWVVVRLMSLFSHTCHFYWYMIFCPRVRKYVQGKLGRKVAVSSYW